MDAAVSSELVKKEVCPIKFHVLFGLLKEPLLFKRFLWAHTKMDIWEN